MVEICHEFLGSHGTIGEIEYASRQSSKIHAPGRFMNPLEARKSLDGARRFDHTRRWRRWTAWEGESI